EQGFSRDLLGAFDRDAVAENWPVGLGLFTAVALGQYQAVVKRLLAGDAARRPCDTAVAVDTVDADAIVVGNEAFVEADEFLIQRRHKHLQLDRFARVGLELDLGVDIPQIIGFVFGHWDSEDEDLVGRYGNAQRDKQEDQNFQVQG